ncbi:MAG TPA: ATP-dependent helicase [Bacteroidales bacterium]|nr:ATP-dependent helicase [Bacteroidales bacterium]
MAFRDHSKKIQNIPDITDENKGNTPVLRSSNDDFSGIPEREELLNNFLSRIIPPVVDTGFISAESQAMDLHNISLLDYPEIAIPTKIELKIKELQTISRSIEQKSVDLSQLKRQDFSKFKVNYASALNPAQLAGVITTEQPVLCIAGAGSGKTRVIVHRVSFLIEKGVSPQAILLLTFTRKAANEMLERVETLLHDKNVGNVAGGTFHSFASFILRKYANLIGLPNNFTIIDTGDSEDIIDLLRTELKFNSKDKKFPKKSRIYEIISYSRNKKSTIKEIIRKQYTGLENYIADIELLYSGYARYKKASHILDFDDLMDVLNESLKNNQRFREIMQNTFQYVMVDEFQDTNVVQNEIVQQIAARHRRIMVVGDDIQSIYAFRGAEYENILRFPQVYPDCAVIKIEENYRSNQHVLDFTNSIIDNTRIGFKKKLFTQIKNQHIPVVQRVYGQDDEAVFIADRILELLEQGVPAGQIAILNRADWHNRYIQAELNKRGIPYIVVGGFKFNERMHIKDIVAYLRLTYNPSDAVSWHRVLKYIGGIGQITASSVITTLQASENPFSFEAFVQRKFYNDMIAMGTMLAKASQPELTLTQKIEIIREYYAPLLKAREDDYLNRMQDIEVLIDLSKKYKNLDRFLSDFALDPPSKRVADQSTPMINEGEEKGKLTISTIHSAKGLEWYAVFIPHALEGLIPSNRAKDIEEMEEERRLFYVACSRAKEELYITFPRMVYSFDAFFNLPSRFLVEIEKDKYVFNT